jgi:acetolactate synthase-1/3 small subunit
MLKKYGVLEFVRSGRIAVSKSKRKTETFLEELEKSTTHSLTNNNGQIN